MNTVKKKHPIRRFIVIIFGILVGCTVFGVSVLLKQGYDIYSEKVSKLPIESAFGTIMRSDDYVGFDQLPSDYVNAVTSVEDHRFFYRRGIDLIAIGKAMLENVTSGTIVRGGSTITQQVAKNIYFDMSQVFSRKTAEIFFVNDMESKFDKETIFSIYVSIINFGDGYFGIKDAALGYLNKPVEELTLCESALLAGLPQSPTNYQLSNHSEATYNRYLQVLAAMVEYDHITQQQYDYCRINVPGGVK